MRHASLGRSRRSASGRKNRLQPGLECLEGRALLAVFPVTDSGDSGALGTLRWAIEQVNSGQGGDTIAFNLSDSPTQTIRVTSALPSLLVPVTIDGRSPSADLGISRVQIDGSQAGAGVSAFTILGGSTTIAGLSIVNFDGDAIRVLGAGGNIIQGNYLGLTSDGSTPAPNHGNGITIASLNNLIGGAGRGDENLISGNQGYGISIEGGAGNRVQGNGIGVDLSGTQKRGNRAGGVFVRDSASNLIGGVESHQGNVISGNDSFGLRTAGSTNGLLVQGNWIGTDPSGTLDLGNRLDGVRLQSDQNTIGGLNAGAGNVIAFNGIKLDRVGAGVSLASNASENRILSNSIHSNAGLGIDLGASGNISLQPPRLDAAASSAESTQIIGNVLGYKPNTSYTLQFFANTVGDPSGFGEGEVFLGTAQVTTDASGNATYSVGFNAIVGQGALLTATATDPDGNTSTFAYNISNQGQSDVGATLTANPEAARPGDLITYTLVITNNGPMVAYGLSATHLLPAGSTLVSANTSDGGISSGPNSILFKVGSLAPGQSATATVIVRTSSESGSSATSTLNVSSMGGDLNPGNNTSSVMVPLGAAVDLQVQVESRPDRVAPGQNVTYVVSLRNAGPSRATNVKLADLLPAHVMLISASASRGEVVYADNQLSVTLPTLDSNDASLVLTIVVATTDLTPSQLLNAAFATANEPDQNTRDNTGTASTTVVPMADLAVKIKAGPGPVLQGQSIVYLVTLTNQGPSAVSNATLTHILPAGVRFLSASDDSGGAIAFQDGVVIDSIEQILPGQEVVLRVVARAVANVPTTLVSTASVSAPQLDDPNPSNNLATLSLPLNLAANLSVSMTGSAETVDAGRSLSYTIVVTNRGPSTATGVILEDVLPPNVEVTSYTLSQGDVEVAGGRLIGKIGTLGLDAFATLVIVIKTPAEGMLSLQNQVAVRSDLADPVADDNTSTITTALAPLTNLKVQMSPLAGPLLERQPTTFVVTVSNLGPSTATNVVLTQSISVGSTILSATGSSGTVQINDDGQIRLLIDRLAVDATATFTLVVRPDRVGTFRTRTIVNGAEPDEDEGDNATNVEVEVVPAADLQLGVVTSQSTLTVGDRLTYTLTVTNQGPSPASGVLLSSQLPAGAILVSATPSQGSTESGVGWVTVRLGDLAVGGTAYVTLVVIPSIKGLGTGVVRVEAREADPNPDNNVQSSTVRALEPPGQFRFASAFETIDENAGVATVVVQRVGGARGQVTVNYFTVLSGTAVPNVDFVPVSGTLVFQDGETSKTFEIPIKANPYTRGDRTLQLVIRGPQGGAKLGDQIATTLTIRDLDPDLTGPSVRELRLAGPANAVQSVTLHFSEPLSQETALFAEGYQLFHVGADGLFGTSDDVRIPLRAPVYDPSLWTVTLTPATPLGANQFYYVQAMGMRDLVGNALESGTDGGPAHVFGSYLARGTSLRYFDSRQTLVTLGVQGGGLLDLTRFANGEGNRLQLLQPAPGRTVLTGRIRGRGGSTTFNSMTGLGSFGGIRVRMSAPSIVVRHLPFNRGYVSPPSVDTVFPTAVAPIPTRPARFRARRIAR